MNLRNNVPVIIWKLNILILSHFVKQKLINFFIKSNIAKINRYLITPITWFGNPALLTLLLNIRQFLIIYLILFIEQIFLHFFSTFFNVKGFIALIIRNKRLWIKFLQVVHQYLLGVDCGTSRHLARRIWITRWLQISKAHTNAALLLYRSWIQSKLITFSLSKAFKARLIICSIFFIILISRTIIKLLLSKLHTFVTHFHASIGLDDFTLHLVIFGNNRLVYNNWSDALIVISEPLGVVDHALLVGILDYCHGWSFWWVVKLIIWRHGVL